MPSTGSSDGMAAGRVACQFAPGPDLAVNHSHQP